MVVSNIYYRHKPNSVINGQHEYIVCDHANHKKVFLPLLFILSQRHHAVTMTISYTTINAILCIIYYANILLQFTL